MFNPADNGFFPKCPFLALTGLKCPGCGSQRAIHALLHADIGAAFRHNALLTASLPAVALLLFAEARRTALPRLYAWLNGVRIIEACFTVIILWWVARNIANA